MNCLSTDYAGMAPQRRREPQPKLFIGEWIHALGMRPRDVARGAGVNEGYLSQLISGQKIKATPGYVRKMANFLGIDWRDMYDPPPSREALRAAATINPATLARLRNKTPE